MKLWILFLPTCVVLAFKHCFMTIYTIFQWYHDEEIWFGIIIWTDGHFIGDDIHVKGHSYNQVLNLRHMANIE